MILGGLRDKNYKFRCIDVPTRLDILPVTQQLVTEHPGSGSNPPIGSDRRKGATKPVQKELGLFQQRDKFYVQPYHFVEEYQSRRNDVKCHGCSSRNEKQ